MRLLKPMLVIQLASWCQPTLATVTTYTNSSAWQNAAGPHSTITFTELPLYTTVTTQYQSLGITFTDGTDLIVDGNIFVNDGVGLYGVFDEITLGFSQPMNSIAVDHPGVVAFRLFYQGQQIYVNNYMGGGGVGFFSGLISTEPFDAALIWDPFNDVVIDDLHFGPPIPAPGALALLGAAALLAQRSRKRQ